MIMYVGNCKEILFDFFSAKKITFEQKLLCRCFIDILYSILFCEY